MNTDSGMTEVLKLADKDFKEVFLTVFKNIKYAYNEIIDMKSQ